MILLACCKSVILHYSCPPSSTGSDTCCISYSSIVNNSAIVGCIWLHFTFSSQCIDTCNILNNKQNYTNSAIIYSYCNISIKDSCILGNNKGNVVFCQSYASGKFTLSYCTIGDDIFSKNRYSGPVIVVKTIEKTFINGLSHIATQSRDSYFD